MDDFEAHRHHLRAVAYRMLGSAGEADDAVQEAWIRYRRADTATVANLGGWLTTVTARICLDLLRARRARRDEPATAEALARIESAAPDPAGEAELADAAGRALLVVLDRLAPAERVAFVLHDVLGVPFAEIGPVLGRTPAATKKLAGRARDKVRARPATRPAELARQRRVVEAFLAAIRAGNTPALLAVLAPDVVRRADPTTLPAGAPVEVRGAARVAETARQLSPRRARYAEVVLLDGTVGAVVAPAGRPVLALRFGIADGLITEFEVIADPARLSALPLAVLDPA